MIDCLNYRFKRLVALLNDTITDHIRIEIYKYLWISYQRRNIEKFNICSRPFFIHDTHWTNRHNNAAPPRLLSLPPALTPLMVNCMPSATCVRPLDTNAGTYDGDRGRDERTSFANIWVNY